MHCAQNLHASLHSICNIQFKLPSSILLHDYSTNQFCFFYLIFSCHKIILKQLKTHQYYCCFSPKWCPTLLQSHRLQPARLLYPWDSPGKNTGVGCHVLFQGFFLTQGLNPHLLQWQASSLPLSHQGSPKYINTPLPDLLLKNCKFVTPATDIHSNIQPKREKMKQKNH